jgi:cell division protein FtsW
MKKQSRNIFFKQFEIGKNTFDNPLIYTTLVLLLMGLGILFSASYYISFRDFQDPYYYIKKQGLWAFIGFFLLIFFSNIKYTFYQENAVYIFLLTLISLILVFIPGIGKSVDTHYGRNFNRWINLGLIQIQPSEFSKIAVPIYLSLIITRIRLTENFDNKKLFLPALIIVVMLILIVLEPAYGTTVEIIAIIGLLLFLSLKNIKIFFFSIIGITPLLYFLMVNVGYRKKRIDVWFNPYKYRFDEGHQLVSSFKSFFDGGLTGSPLSTSYSHKYLTYSHTDFILSSFVADFGFFGFLVLLFLFAILIFRGIYLIKRVQNMYAFFLGSGLIFLIGLQFLINTYVVTGLFPTTGISLPFVSYGGSSLITIMISIGIILNITKKENLN